MSPIAITASAAACGIYPASRREYMCTPKVLVYGPYKSIDVVTSLIAGRNIRKNPETIAGLMSGSVISARLSECDAPQALDASSSEEDTCISDADEVFIENDKYLAMYATKIIQSVL